MREKNFKRFEELDVFRGIASIFVVFYHYTVRYFELFDVDQSPLIRVNKGGYGVDLFFILSGFVIFYSIERNSSIKRFIVGRILRLYPAYIISVILTFFVVRIYGLENRMSSWFTGLVNLTMFQEFFGVENVDGVYWTLAIEWGFYIAIVIVLLFKLQKKIVPTILIWSACYTVLKLSDVFSYVPASLARVELLLSYSFLFCLGILFYKFSKSNDKKDLLYSVPVFLVYWLVSGTADLGVGLFIYFIFLAFSFGLLKFICTKWLVFLGAISYPLYLIHQNIGYVFLQWFGDLGVDVNISILLTVSIVIFISWVIHILIETPAIKFSKKIHKSYFD